MCVAPLIEYVFKNSLHKQLQKVLFCFERGMILEIDEGERCFLEFETFVCRAILVFAKGCHLKVESFRPHAFVIPYECSEEESLRGNKREKTIFGMVSFHMPKNRTYWALHQGFLGHPSKAPSG